MLWRWVSDGLNLTVWACRGAVNRGTQQSQADRNAGARWLGTRVRTRGSHWQLKHRDRRGRVTAPHPVKDIPVATVASIYRQAGWR